MKKQNQESKVVDLSVIPPCFSSLYLQIKRSNFIAAMWKRTEPYPEDIDDLLLEETCAVILSDKIDFYEIDVESDNDHDFL